MTNDNKVLCNKMVGIANTYKNSAELLNVANQIITLRAAQQGIKDPHGNPLEFNDVIFSRLLLYSLNIEILLKAIYIVEHDTTIKEHDWIKIFNAISKSRQKEIVNNMEAIYKENFSTLLESNKNTFISWRYSYEHDVLKSDFSFVQNLANVLYSIVALLIK